MKTNGAPPSSEEGEPSSVNTPPSQYIAVPSTSHREGKESPPQGAHHRGRLWPSRVEETVAYLMQLSTEVWDLIWNDEPAHVVQRQDTTC